MIFKYDDERFWIHFEPVEWQALQNILQGNQTGSLDMVKKQLDVVKELNWYIAKWDLTGGTRP